MKENLTDLICCPACGNPLTITATTHHSGEIWEGSLICSQSHTFPIQNGMPHLYIDDERWQPKAVEAEGWITSHKNLGIYKVVEEPVDFQIPYFDGEPWSRVAKSFDVALAELRLTGQEVVLDLGAGRGWAAKEFAKLGCRVVALDILPDEIVGLGRAHAIMHHHNTYFERIIADGENLPLFADKFDLVFCSATLHHSSHLALLLTNVQKVLKRKGRLCAIQEPCVSVAESEAYILERDAQEELALGINETRPNLIKYVDGIEASGMEVSKIYSLPAFQMDDVTLQRWGKDMGAIFPPISVRHPANTLSYFRYYAGPRWETIKKGEYRKARKILAGFAGRNCITASVLCWAGGELFLLATKP